MTDNRDKIARFADRLVKLADDYRDDRASVVEDAKKAEIDTAALGRLVSWMRKDHVKRVEQEAIDEQYRFLAGETETPATLPAEGMLSEAARLYRDKLSVRQVAGVLKISTGKAFKLKALAELFTVHVHADVNTPKTSPKAPDASSTVTARATVSTTGDAQGEDDGRRSRTSDANGDRHDPEPSSPQRNPGGKGRGNEPVRPDAPDGAGLSDAGHGRGLSVATAALPRQCGIAEGGGEDRRGAVAKEEAIAPPESLGAVAKPEAERVAKPNLPDDPNEDKLEFLPFLTKAGQRALPPNKEK